MQTQQTQIICILKQNGSEKIGGLTTNGKFITEGQAVTIIFIDSTQGWFSKQMMGKSISCSY
jgi:hypothetical protein